MKKTVFLAAGLALLSPIVSIAQQWGGSATQTGDIYRTGNVGIGTTTPITRLHVTGNSVFTNVTGYPTSAAYIRGNSNQSSATTPDYTWWNNDQTGLFHPAGDVIGFTTGGTEKMRVHSNGNVGVGTTNPLFKMHVNNGGLMISGTTPGDGGPQLLFSDDATNYPQGRWAIEYLTADASRPSMGGLHFWKPFPDAGGAGNYTLFLKDDGKIGMGVTDDNSHGSFCASALPNGYRLYVNGGILTTKVKVANYCSTSWADYVFADDYQLKPLSEVESYIKENNHLPNIPSAEELEEKGLDLAEMASMQMEKIEELTLYMIQLEKDMQQLKADNAALKAKLAEKH